MNGYLGPLIPAKSALFTFDLVSSLGHLQHCVLLGKSAFKPRRGKIRGAIRQTVDQGPGELQLGEARRGRPEPGQ